MLSDIPLSPATFSSTLKKKESYFDYGLPLEELHYIWQQCEYSLKAKCYLCNRVELSLSPDLIVHL